MQILESELIALTNLLHDWADWQRQHHINTGYPQKAAGFSGTGLSSFEDMCDQSDSVVMISIDTAIDGLIPAQRAAINRCYGVCSVFRFPRENYETLLNVAHTELAIIVKRKGVVL